MKTISIIIYLFSHEFFTSLDLVAFHKENELLFWCIMLTSLLNQNKCIMNTNAWLNMLNILLLKMLAKYSKVSICNFIIIDFDNMATTKL